jgi:hypothetical protein
MKKLSVLVLVLFAVSACKGPSDGDTATDSPTPPGEAAVANVNEVNVGDAEQMIDLIVDLASDSKGPGISASPLTDPLGRTTMLTLDVEPPHPKELWLNYTIRARRTFPETPVVLRIKIVTGDLDHRRQQNAQPC